MLFLSFLSSDFRLISLPHFVERKFVFAVLLLPRRRQSEEHFERKGENSVCTALSFCFCRRKERFIFGE